LSTNVETTRIEAAMRAFPRTELADLNVFVTICRRCSFHAMRNLELGVKLLNRTSHSVVPTAAGSALGGTARQVLC